MFKRTFTASFILGAAALAPPAAAQVAPPCFDRDRLVANLTEQYEENLSGTGLRTTRQLLELWSSDETGTFTIFITHPDGTSCIVASGKNWQPVTGPDGERVVW
jgi:hypothetical protein